MRDVRLQLYTHASPLQAACVHVAVSQDMRAHMALSRITQPEVINNRKEALTCPARWMVDHSTCERLGSHMVRLCRKSTHSFQSSKEHICLGHTSAPEPPLTVPIHAFPTCWQMSNTSCILDSFKNLQSENLLHLCRNDVTCFTLPENRGSVGPRSR